MVEVTGCMNTGIYINSSSGTVTGCKVYDNGRVTGDTGDRGGIGSYQGGAITFIHNEVYRNGPDDDNCDFEISVVEPSTAVTITRNYVHDAGQGAIQLADGGNNSEISYNIVNGFGSTTYDGDGISPGKFSGIRIGTPSVAITGVKVWNNTVVGGVQASGTGHAAFFVRNDNCTGFSIRNNLFLNNATKDVYIYSGVDTSGWTLSNNLYYKTSFTDNWYWTGTNYSTLATWATASGETNGLDSDPKVVDEANANFRLQSDSPAIDAGVDVGLDKDFDSVDVAQGSAVDIGALERVGVGISLPDADMEAAGTSSYYAYTCTISKDTATVKEGAQSLKVLGNTAGGGNRAECVPVEVVHAGDQYTFSVWVYAESTTYRVGIYARDMTNAANIFTDSAAGCYVTTADTWVKLTRTFTIPSGCKEIEIWLVNRNSADAAYFDNVQLVLNSGSVPQSDSDMETAGTSAYTAYTSTISKDTTTVKNGSQSLKILGSITGSGNRAECAPVTVTREGDQYTLSMWVYAESTTYRVGMTVRDITNSANVFTDSAAGCNVTTANSWVQLTKTFTIPDGCDEIGVWLVNRNSTDVAYFDDVQLSIATE
jgi:hypothetical protein